VWLDDRTRREYQLPFPKGVLITGVPGCGKSLTAKCTSAEWGLPLLRLDMGRVFARYVGSSEENLRTAIRVAEAVAPCILFIDEVEKGMSGGTGGPSADSGVARRVFGTFLTWMQEKTKPVFVIATANDIAALPPEFLRKGRFDEIFFVDLPDQQERAAIWGIYLERLRTSPRIIDGFPLGTAVYQHLADLSEGFSGAEIEQGLHDARFRAYAGQRPLTLADIEGVLAVTHPLVDTSKEDIARLREWARHRAVRASSGQVADHPRQRAPSRTEPAPGRFVEMGTL
jgi:SpoVK/Ycf46/Vps4 family AAA+-type ATPase